MSPFFPAAIRKDHFGTIYPTLAEAVIKKGNARTPKVFVKGWKLGDVDDGFIVFYNELVTEFSV